jgi:hypothetical protein
MKKEEDKDGSKRKRVGYLKQNEAEASNSRYQQRHHHYRRRRR